MTAGDVYYYTSLLVEGLVIVFTSSTYLVYITDNGKKKIKGSGIFIILLILLLTWSNCNIRKINNEETTKADSISNAKYDSIHVAFTTSNSSIKTLNESINDIKKALKEKNLAYDSVNKKVAPINPQFYMPNATVKGGHNQFGNGNTQNN